MLLLVGLGNPGSRHAGNRHNIGFMAVDEIARRHDFGPWRRRFMGLAAEGRIDGTRILALKPETFMNESGRAVGEALRFFKLDPASLLVFHDELDLKPGKVRVKHGGGAAGHNGLRSLEAHVGRDYRRVRMGIGHPGHKDRVQPYVLRGFSKAEAPLAEKMVDAVAGEITRLLAGDDEGFMSRVAFLVAPPRPKPPPKPAPKPERAADAAAPETAGTDGE